MKRSAIARRTPLSRARLRAAGRLDPARSLEYAKARETILGRSEGRCELCRAPITLASMAAHHRLPRSAGRVDSPSNLIATCHADHAGIHERPKGATADGRIISRHDRREPAEIPVRLAGGWFLLTAGGTAVHLPGWTSV